VPGCRPPPGTSRFKFPKNQKKQKLWLNSLKIDTNEIGDSRVCALHFAKSDFKPNLSTFLEIPEISSKRKFLLPSAIPSLTVKEPRSPSGTLKKLNHKCIIKDLLEMEEMEMSIMQEETTSSVQTQTDLTMEDIFDLESAKNSLRGLTFDLGNHKFQSETEIMKSVHGSFRHSMTNPADPSRKVYMFPDIPHMIKLMRNHCLDHGLAFLNDTGEYCTLKMEDFKEVLLKDGKELKLCPKLKPIHLTVQGSMRQRVCLATQLFSHTVAMALLYHQGKRGETKSKAILTINNYCDTMNSRWMYDAVPYRCGLGIHQDLQIESLLKMKSLVENMKFCDNMDKKSLKPFQKGFLISIESTFALLKEAQVTVQIYYH